VRTFKLKNNANTSPDAPQDLARPMEAAIDRAWAQVATMEPEHPALSGFSNSRPAFLRDETGLIRGRLFFSFNATRYGKDQMPSAADKSKPYCFLVVSVWRKNDLPGQPVASQQGYRIGKNNLEGFVTVFSNDDGLAKSIRETFELEMQNAADRKRSEPGAPPGAGEPRR